MSLMDSRVYGGLVLYLWCNVEYTEDWYCVTGAL